MFFLLHPVAWTPPDRHSSEQDFEAASFLNAGSGLLRLHSLSRPSTPRTLSPSPKSGVLFPSSKAFQHLLESESDFGLRGMCEL